MSVSLMAILLPLVISFLATLAWALISGSWTFRSVSAMFAFGFLLLWLPSVIHA